MASALVRAGEPETGEWSEPVGGVQGRLTITEDPELNGTKILAVYLELRNVSDVGTPLEIYFDPHQSTQCRLLDAKGQSLENATGLAASILTPFPFWLTLPYDSSLRFRISVSGYGVSKDAGSLIPLLCGPWVIEPGAEGERALEVTLIGKAPKEEPDRRVWKGTLKLPKVKVPR